MDYISQKRDILPESTEVTSSQSELAEMDSRKLVRGLRGLFRVAGEQIELITRQPAKEAAARQLKYYYPDTDFGPLNNESIFMGEEDTKNS